jgi:hypothetical protein
MTEAECKTIMNTLIDYWFAKLLERMERGQSFENALTAVREEIMTESEAKP